MSLTDSVKRAPRWAYLTAAGVGVGAVGIKLWRDRDKPPEDPTVAAEYNAGPNVTDPIYAGGGGTPGVIVPPVIIGGSSDDPQAGLVDVQSMYGDLFGTMTGMIEALMGAGAAPPSAQQQPTPVVSYDPLPQATPTPVPSPIPVPVATVPQPTTSSAPTCASLYPSYPQHHAADGPPGPNSCYKSTCESHQVVHTYKNGRRQGAGTKC